MLVPINVHFLGLIKQTVFYFPLELLRLSEKPVREINVQDT